MAEIMASLNALREKKQCRLNFGKKISRWREELGITQSEFAKEAGITRQALIKYELHPDDFKKGIPLERIIVFLRIFSAKIKRDITPEEFLQDVVNVN